MVVGFFSSSHPRRVLVASSSLRGVSDGGGSVGLLIKPEFVDGQGILFSLFGGVGGNDRGSLAQARRLQLARA